MLALEANYLAKTIERDKLLRYAMKREKTSEPLHINLALQRTCNDGLERFMTNALNMPGLYIPPVIKH